MKLFDHQKKPILALFFKDLAHWTMASCVGLTVAGYATAQYLRQHGVKATAYPVRHNIDLVNVLEKATQAGERPTHAVISAPWMILYDVEKLVAYFSDIRFVILSHSNIGFLQADPSGVELLRKYAELAEKYPNLSVGGNSLPFVEWFRAAYAENCNFLPNLYPLDRVRSKVWNRKPPVKIGAFGAIRPEKNFMTAAAAAVAVRSMLKMPVELHMSTGGESCRSMALPAIAQMVAGIDGFTLVSHDWDTWDKFVELVGSMDLLLQTSYTESFNMVTADGIFKGVPSVVSPVIRWAPEAWKADSDDAMDVARTAVRLLTSDQKCIGSRALEKHNKISLKYWLEFLNFVRNTG